MGRLCTKAVPSASNTPSPTPSGSRRLCTARLSGASTSQNVAATRRGAADSPNSRHMRRLPTGVWWRGAGSVVEPGGIACRAQRAGLGPQFGQQPAQVGQQQVGEVVGEPVAYHDPQHGQVGAVGGEGVGGYQQ